jgi:hypothetical protein
MAGSGNKIVGSSSVRGIFWVKMIHGLIERPPEPALRAAAGYLVGYLECGSLSALMSILWISKGAPSR